MMRSLRILLLLMVFPMIYSGCAIYHHYGPYYGKLVDAETKVPLEGAVVLATYVTYMHATPGGVVVHFLDTQEVVSDKKGEFNVPSLNVFAFRPLSTFSPEPAFKIFKPRYQCYEFEIAKDKYATIELQELKTREERIRNTDCYPTIVPDAKMGKFISANNAENISLGLQPTHVGEIKK